MLGLNLWKELMRIVLLLAVIAGAIWLWNGGPIPYVSVRPLTVDENMPSFADVRQNPDRASAARQPAPIPTDPGELRRETRAHRSAFNIWSESLIRNAEAFAENHCDLRNRMSLDYTIARFDEDLSLSSLATLDDVRDRNRQAMRVALRGLIQTNLLRYHDLPPRFRELVQDEDGRRPAVTSSARSC